MNKYLKLLIAVLTIAVLTYAGLYVFLKLKKTSVPVNELLPERPLTEIPVDDGLPQTVFNPESRTFRLELPSFIPSIRTYGGGGFDEFQLTNLQELGFQYVQSAVDFQWQNIEPRNNQWKWGAADSQMDALARNKLKTIAFIMWPKSVSVPWDENTVRNSPAGVSEFGEFAYEVVNRYKNHPAWSGLIAVWGGSADVWDRNYPDTNPEVVVPLLNAAYDGIKRADPNTTVIGFNFATTYGETEQEWEEYHTRAFAMRPKFDWYGVQSHAVSPTTISSSNKYGGLQGLIEVRRFLDSNGYADKPLWLNEGGYFYGSQTIEAQVQAEQSVETFIMSPSIPVNLKGWVYFAYFGKTDDDDEGLMGIMTSTSLGRPEPRPAWNAIKTLLKTVGFADYRFEAKISGEPNQTAPFIYKFAKQNNNSSKLWTVFVPRSAPTQKGEPYRNSPPQNVTINIGANTTANIIEMYGQQRTMQTDSSGNISVQATNSPLYIKVGE